MENVLFLLVLCALYVHKVLLNVKTNFGVSGGNITEWGMRGLCFLRRI